MNILNTFSEFSRWGKPIIPKNISKLKEERFNNENRTSLQIAARFNKPRHIKTILNKLNIKKENNKEYINHTNSKGKTALILAAEYGKIDIVNMLLEKGADINKTDAKGKNALMFASSEGHLDVVKLLLTKNININKQTNDNKTALMMACEAGHIDVVKFLIENGADINIIYEISNNYRNKNDIKAIRFARRYGHWNIVKLLESQNKFENSTIRSILSLSFDRSIEELQKLEELVKILKKFPSIINRKDKKGNTILIIASKLGKINIVEFRLYKIFKLGRRQVI
jgi:ankyrin repeat protein